MSECHIGSHSASSLRLFTYVSDECSAADVSVSAESEGDLPGELAVAGINTIDDAAARALLAAS